MLTELNYPGQEKEPLLSTCYLQRTKQAYKINKRNLCPQGTTSQENLNNAIHDSQSAAEAQNRGIHSPIWVLEKTYYERGVSQVLLTTTSLIQRPNSGHLAMWPKDFTRRKARPLSMVTMLHRAQVLSYTWRPRERTGMFPGLQDQLCHHL